MENKPQIIVSSEYVDDEEDEYYIRDASGKMKQATKEEYDEFIKKQQEENANRTQKPNGNSI